MRGRRPYAFESRWGYVLTNLSIRSSRVRKLSSTLVVRNLECLIPRAETLPFGVVPDNSGSPVHASSQCCRPSLSEQLASQPASPPTSQPASQPASQPPDFQISVFTVFPMVFLTVVNFISVFHFLQWFCKLFVEVIEKHKEN